MDVVLIACASKKQNKKAKAKELYVSTLFSYALRYAESLKPDVIFILSAKYGLLALDKTIEPYNVTLNTMTMPQKKKWAEQVLLQLRKVADVHNDTLIFLAGEQYRKYLIPSLSHYKIPLQGLSIGKQLQYLKRAIA
ncbi:hypothetical protein C4573_03370 [Candidatus Woesearchaeota archaeon]|nr:MAG: hypothetical protein C4573_03370 [Candidatus Woesearchaeota archaeon]